jgi:hypothetical protein
MNGVTEIDMSEEDCPNIIRAKPAAEVHVQTVLQAAVDTGDGRSKWYWFRLPNGDLMLGCFPQGDTYFMVEEDTDF